MRATDPGQQEAVILIGEGEGCGSSGEAKDGGHQARQGQESDRDPGPGLVNGGRVPSDHRLRSGGCDGNIHVLSPGSAAVFVIP